MEAKKNSKPEPKQIDTKALPKKNPKAPNKYSEETKRYAVKLHKEGKSLKEIENLMQSVKLKALKRWIKKYS